MSTTLSQQYRLRTNDANDGALAFLKPSEAAGFGLPEVVHAYAAGGQESRPVQVPRDAILSLEPV